MLQFLITLSNYLTAMSAVGKLIYEVFVLGASESIINSKDVMIVSTQLEIDRVDRPLRQRPDR